MIHKLGVERKESTFQVAKLAVHQLKINLVWYICRRGNGEAIQLLTQQNPDIDISYTVYAVREVQLTLEVITLPQACPMDDLSGLEWTSASNNQKSNTPSYPSWRPSPAPSSGRSTPNVFKAPPPATSQPSLRIGSKPATPAHDSFANLLSGGQPKVNNNVSLQERQRQIIAEKAKQSQQLDTQFGARGSPSLIPGRVQSSNGSRILEASSASAKQQQTRTTRADTTQDEVDDILAAFNTSVQVDTASHFPPQSAASSRLATPLSNTVVQSVGESNEFPEDDDPFGLNQLAARPQSQAQQSIQATDDGDFLGMLGRPVHEVIAMNKPKVAVAISPESSDSEDLPTNPSDRAVAELVDMGFSSDKAAIALAQTDSGHDVIAAVGILLNQAHEDSRKKTQTSQSGGDQSPTRRDESSGARRARSPNESAPSWLKRKDDASRSNSRGRAGVAGAENDVAKLASDIGSTLFKSANSLWKTSQKKVQKAMAELQQEGGVTNQPKWMRDAQLAEDDRKNRKAPEPHSRRADFTDEAAMLDSINGRPTAQPSSTISRQKEQSVSMDRYRGQSHNSFDQRSSSPRETTSSRTSTPVNPFKSASRATKEDLEKESPEAYISPARRRKAPPVTEASSTESTAPKKSPLASPPIQSNNPFSSTPKPFKSISTPVPIRPQVPTRQIPSVSSLAIASSSSQRQKGTEAFKRGDFPSAHVAYSAALQPLPQSHPIAIVIFCNRALTSLKNGDPKAAIADAESAISIIGISKGEGERINLGSNEGEKDMKEFYGKALMRKAEALESLEKWTDAGKIWREAVEAGIGGSISIQGRTRCEKSASGGQHAPSTVAARSNANIPSRIAQKPKAAVRRPVTSNIASQEAVKKLRQANVAAEKADDEKFALTDQVDAKLLAWKGSKADNLRALLGSLDNVLWPEAGWTKVSMADLIMVNRVKIIYMKAIAKVHPDKVSINIPCSAIALTISRYLKPQRQNNVC